MYCRKLKIGPRVRSVFASMFALCLGLSISSPGIAGAQEPRQDARAVASVERSEIDQFVDAVGVDFLRNQETLNELKGWILDQPNATENGYIDQVNDADNLSVRLLWYGDGPFLEQVQEHVAKLGIKTTVEKRSMSLKQIQEAADRIWGNKEEYKKAGLEITSISAVGATGDGLTVNGTYTGRLSAVRGRELSQDAQQSRKALAESMAEMVGGPVALGESGTWNASGTRSTDASPFSAGGYMINSKGSTCSTGFSLKYKGKKYATTALQGAIQGQKQ